MNVFFVFLQRGGILQQTRGNQILYVFSRVQPALDKTSYSSDIGRHHERIVSLLNQQSDITRNSTGGIQFEQIQLYFKYAAQPPSTPRQTSVSSQTYNTPPPPLPPPPKFRGGNLGIICCWGRIECSENIAIYQMSVTVGTVKNSKEPFFIKILLDWKVWVGRR